MGCGILEEALKSIASDIVKLEENILRLMTENRELDKRVEKLEGGKKTYG